MAAEGGLDVGRLARTLALIAVVTAISMLVLAERLGGRLLLVGSGAIAAVAVVTGIIAFLIAAGEYYDETEQRL